MKRPTILLVRQASWGAFLRTPILAGILPAFWPLALGHPRPKPSVQSAQMGPARFGVLPHTDALN
eukprot:scaffold84436_cov17-Tisochrysis_lutea.AAC.1